MTAATSVTPAPPASARAVTSVVLGIAGFALCGLLSPFAWWLGHLEVAAARHRAASNANEDLGRLGMILGIIGSLPLLIAAAALLLCIPLALGAFLLVAIVG